MSLYVYIDCCSAFVDAVGARADVVSGKQPEVVSKPGKQPEVVSTNDFCLQTWSAESNLRLSVSPESNLRLLVRMTFVFATRDLFKGKQPLL